MSSEIEILEDRIKAKMQALHDSGFQPEQTAQDINTHLQSAYADSFALTCLLLSFGLIILLLITYLIKTGKDPEQLLRSFGTVLIIIAAVFLIVAGYSEKQIAPVIGLLGTIVGYLLGKSSVKKET